MAVCVSAAFITDEVQDLVSLFHGSDTISLHVIMFIIISTQDSFIPVEKKKNQIAIIPSSYYMLSLKEGQRG